MHFHKKPEYPVEGTGDGGGDGDKPVTIERILAAGIMRGLTKADTNTMTIGGWVDFIIEYDNIQYESQENRDEDGNQIVRRTATQADFDSFC